MPRILPLSLTIVALSFVCAAQARAQDAVLTQMYGSGVHAFFSQDYQKAYEQLTAAIDGGSRDPRCRYFRGLAYMKLGRPEEARLEFDEGAKLEMGDLNRVYSVSKSLERVQGAVRVELEGHRVKARMVALEQAEKQNRLRYQQREQEQDRFLRSQADAAPKDGQEAAPGAEAVPDDQEQSPATDDPFSVPGMPVAPKAPAAVEPAAEQPAAEEPAAEQPVAPQPPAVEPEVQTVEKPAADPFEMPAAGQQPAEKEPAAEEAPGPALEAQPEDAAKPAGKRRGGLLGAMGRAMGRAAAGDDQAPKAPAIGPAEKEPAFGPAEEKPAAPGADDDPFGVPPAAAPAAEKPAAEEPAPAEEAPPAAEEKPAAPASDDDPFAVPPAAEQPAEEKPADGAAAPGASPFIEEPPAEKAPAEEAPAENPPAEKPDDDPFAP